METLLGERLLQRSRGHVAGLTESGQRLLPFARKILATIDDAWTSLNHPALSGSIRVGLMDDIDVHWLNELLGRFRVGHPDCDVRAVSDFSSRLERRLAAGEIDLALTKRVVPPGRRGGGKGVLSHEPLTWAAGPGFRWDGQRPLPLVVFHEGCAYRRHILQQLADLGVASQVVYDGQSYANVRDAAQAGFGITALAHSQVLAGGLMPLKLLGRIRLKPLGTVEIMLRTAGKGHSTPALTALIQEIERHYRGSAR